MSAPVAPRPAASLVLLRGAEAGALQVLMGRRSATARFMPNTPVFPGGVLEAADVALAERLAAVGAPGLPEGCRARLAQDAAGEGADAPDGSALALAAVRETFEEAGARVGRRSRATPLDAAPPASGEMWGRFAEGGVAPALDRLRFIFRAVTPPEQPIRFDARFFLASATDLIEDGSTATGDGELERVGWIPLEDARAEPLAFVTHLVLAEIAEATAPLAAEGLTGAALVERLVAAPWTRAVPFFRHDGGADGAPSSQFTAL